MTARLVGGGRKNDRRGREYVSLSLAFPELGPRKLYANLDRGGGQDDGNAFALIRHLED